RLQHLFAQSGVRVFVLDGQKGFVSFGVTAQIAHGLRGPIPRVFAKKRVSLSFQEPAQGLSHAVVGKVLVSEGQRSARTPSIRGVFRCEGGKLCVGVRRAIAKLARDRKSTRLNSSHSQISYAVF